MAKSVIVIKEAAMLFERFAKIEPILKGFSSDKKYCATAHDGTKYLLRIMRGEKFEMWENLFEILGHLVSLGVPMSKPVELGTCEDGAYALFSWIDGEDLNTALPKLSEAEQYKLGVKAGEILRMIHSISAPENQENWASQFNQRIDNNIKKYRDCEIKIDGGDNFIKYIEHHRHLIKDCPQVFKHGDYHVHNMMLENGELWIIDFDRVSYGIPLSEFNKIFFSARVSPHFATGQVHGYFGGQSPAGFFELLAIDISARMLAGISWAIPHGQDEVDFVISMCEAVLKWHDNMNNPVPSWYLGN